MKHTKRIITIAVFTFLSFVQATAANSNDSIKPLPVELKYIGEFKNQPLLQLDFTGSPEENEFSISITDESGYTFYTGIVKGEKISKQFLLDVNNLGDAAIRFQITGKKSGNTAVYKVTRYTKISEQMDLVKL